MNCWGTGTSMCATISLENKPPAYVFTLPDNMLEKEGSRWIPSDSMTSPDGSRRHGHSGSRRGSLLARLPGLSFLLIPPCGQDMRRRLLSIAVIVLVLLKIAFALTRRTNAFVRATISNHSVVLLVTAAHPEQTTVSTLLVPASPMPSAGTKVDFPAPTAFVPICRPILTTAVTAVLSAWEEKRVRAACVPARRVRPTAVALVSICRPTLKTVVPVAEAFLNTVSVSMASRLVPQVKPTAMACVSICSSMSATVALVASGVTLVIACVRVEAAWLGMTARCSAPNQAFKS